MIKYLNLVLFVVMIVMNYLANALPLNNKTTGQLSDGLPNLFVPAGITFSIWGIIYLLLAGFCIVQFTRADQDIILRIGWLFAVTCGLNALWILAWHYQKLPLSLVIMIGMLVTLILINTRIRELPFGLIKASFGIYLGWICIATIANVTALLVNYKWSGFGISETGWAIIMIIIGALLVSVTIIRLRNPFIGLAVMWAFIGIYIKRNSDYRIIAIVALTCIVMMTAITLLGFLSRKLGLDF